jgi:hypothetical protein
MKDGPGRLGCQLTWQPNVPDTEFRVSQFKNRNGVTSWRVSGWLAGVRIRKNFRSKAEAAAEKGTLDIQAAQLAAGVRSAATFLIDPQLREAESAACPRHGGGSQPCGQGRASPPTHSRRDRAVSTRLGWDFSDAFEPRRRVLAKTPVHFSCVRFFV